MTARIVDIPEFVFELHACRWAELGWPPGDGGQRPPRIVGRQLGTRYRRWDTVVIECHPDQLERRRQFGPTRLDGDLLHVIRHAPDEWAWYRDALPEPEYPWRYVREAIHQAADRDILATRKVGGRIEIKRRWRYPAWADRIIAIEHKPDLDASAADSLASQLEYDVALGLADEVWLATAATARDIPPALFEAMPVDVGILAIDPDALTAEVVWHPRQLDIEAPGTRILERPGASDLDRSAARFEYLSAAAKADLRRRIAERAYERGWRGCLAHMRHDCRHFTLAVRSPTHEPVCRAKGRAPSGAECSSSCPSFEPEPPGWRTQGWPIEGGPGRGQRRLYERQRARRR